MSYNSSDWGKLALGLGATYALGGGIGTDTKGKTTFSNPFSMDFLGTTSTSNKDGVVNKGSGVLGGFESFGKIASPLYSMYSANKQDNRADELQSFQISSSKEATALAKKTADDEDARKKKLENSYSMGSNGSGLMLSNNL